MSEHSSATHTFRLEGRHVLTMCLAFLGVVLIANGTFIYAALSTHTGVVASEPYRKGLHYNRRIAAERRQAELGWTATTHFDPASRKVSVVVRRADGAPVTALAVTATLSRPATDSMDQRLVLKEADSGRYQSGALDLPPGAWILAIEAEASGANAEEALFRSKERLWLAP